MIGCTSAAGPSHEITPRLPTIMPIIEMDDAYPGPNPAENRVNPKDLAGFSCDGRDQCGRFGAVATTLEATMSFYILDLGDFSIESTSMRVARDCQVATFLVLLSGSLCAQDRPLNSRGSSESDRAAISFCLDGVKEMCGLLKSGHARFTGSINSDFRLNPTSNINGDLEGVVAYDGEKIRFDIARPGWVVDKSQNASASAQPAEKAKMERGTIIKRFATDGTKAAIWSSGQPIVTIGQQSDLPDLRFTEHIDFRCPTLFDRYSIGQGWTLEQILERFDTEFPEECSCQKQAEGIWTLIWIYRGERDVTRWLLTVDTSRGFVPTNYRCETQFSSSPETWTPEWENRTEWKQISNAWVPVRSERLVYVNPASNLEESLIMEFVWHSVNEPLDADLFTYKGFDVPEDVAIQDSSGGESVWIKHLPGYEVAAIESRRVPRNARLFLIVTAALVVIFLAFLGYRLTLNRATLK